MATFVHTFSRINSFVPSASKLGSQPCWVACLLVCVSVVGYAKNSAAEKIILLPACFCFETKFQQYYTRTAPDDDNFCLFLWLLALDIYLLCDGSILYDVGKNSTIIFSAKALLMICFINANKTCNVGTVLFKAMGVWGWGGGVKGLNQPKQIKRI
jgi:hypothetical protein